MNGMDERSDEFMDLSVVVDTPETGRYSGLWCFSRDHQRERTKHALPGAVPGQALSSWMRCYGFLFSVYLSR